jgi:tRNA threonylcarbamoyladenosine biosynthesis protein TsaE
MNKELKRKTQGFLQIITHSPEETKLWGERLGKLLEPGALICLIGELGTGKTCFIQGLSKGVGVKEHQYVASPTFVMMMEHEGRMPFYHFDLYRLEDPEELMELGCLDFIYGQGVAAVEWAEKAPEIFTGERIEIYLERLSDNERSLNLIPVGMKSRKILREFSKEF